MKFSIITPSFNQAEYLEQTLLSVICQEGVDLEYIVMDGGSTDGSAELLQKHSKHLAHWESAPDRGQSDAIHRGFQKATGDIVAWLNSDDTYEPGTLQQVQSFFQANPDVVFMYGDYFVLYPDGRKILKPKVSWDFNIALYAYLMVPQPSAFWRRDAYEALGGLNTNYHYAMDWDLFLRFGRRYPGKLAHLPIPFSTFRVHANSKSVSQRESFKKEHESIRRQFHNNPRWLRKLKEKLYLLKIQWLYLTQRKCLQLRKDQAKA